jgi:methylated-DNA-protein-cysteine methyltransferase-like protein
VFSLESFSFEHVYQVVRLVPYGRVTTYGAIARYLGSEQSARMVGWAMNACQKSAIPVPAHRVVNRQGRLTGGRHFGGDNMQQLLEAEGVPVENNKLTDFERFFWDPDIEVSG